MTTNWSPSLSPRVLRISSGITTSRPDESFVAWCFEQLLRRFQRTSLDIRDLLRHRILMERWSERQLKYNVLYVIDNPEWQR